MRVAIVEDNSIMQSLIKEYLQKFSAEISEPFEIETFADGSDIISGYVPRFDILLLDIEMPYIDGMKTAELIREVDKEVVIIFVTNTPHYAIKGYSVNAMSYILKPLQYYVFAQELTRAVGLVRSKSSKSIMVPSANGFMKLDVNDIMYVESQKNKVSIKHKDGEVSFYSTLKEIEEKIDSKAFVRCNSCYLVNLKWVRGVEDTFALVGDDRLAISRPRRKEFLQELTDYVAGL